jgi:hypothetical protein
LWACQDGVITGAASGKMAVSTKAAVGFCVFLGKFVIRNISWELYLQLNRTGAA